MTVKDVDGKEITFLHPPQKIVSLIPSATEILFALGLGPRIVGVCDYDNYPREVETKVRVGAVKINAEILLKLDPDLVFAEKDLNAGAISGLRALGFKVFLTHPESLEEVIANITLFGRITGRSSQALVVTDTMRAQAGRVLKKIAAVAQNKKVSVFIEHYPGLYTAGRGTFMHELITMAGGLNIASTIKGWGRLNEEQIFHHNPDVILYTQGHKRQTTDNLEHIIKARTTWAHIAAIKNKRVYGIDPDIISRAGPRLTTGLEAIARKLYPDSYAE
jgi:iron complex transport system substrate-binding protein